MTIKLQKFFPTWNVVDPSPPCIKVESFLRLANIDYDVIPFDVKSFKEAPKGRLPFIITDENQKIGDSTLIIEYLKELKNIDLNESLNDKEKAISHACCSMIDETLYYILVYSRWIDPVGWTETSKSFFASVPRLIRGLIENMQRKKVINRMHEQGFGLNTKDENYNVIAREALQSLSSILGKDKWFFGQEKPTLLDIYCHAYISNFAWTPANIGLKKITLEFDNLVQHAQNFQDGVYSDYNNDTVKEAA